MPKFTVEVFVTGSYFQEMEIEADNADLALEIAQSEHDIDYEALASNTEMTAEVII